MQRRTATALCVAAFVVAAAVVGRADTAGDAAREESRKLVDDAEVHYKLGRFAEALASYSKAYELLRAPALLFNIGQCHRHLRSYDQAIFFFEGYLREKRDSRNRRVVEELIAEARQELEKQRQAKDQAERDERARRQAEEEAAEAERERARRAAEATTRMPAPGTSAFDLGAGATAPPRAPARPIYRQWWFWAAAGAVVAVTVGIVALSAGGDEIVVPPRGTTGTLDRRQ
jgi:tetratricopeptide (TPR) repeat protein